MDQSDRLVCFIVALALASMYADQLAGQFYSWVQSPGYPSRRKPRRRPTNVGQCPTRLAPTLLNGRPASPVFPADYRHVGGQWVRNTITE